MDHSQQLVLLPFSSETTVPTGQMLVSSTLKSFFLIAKKLRAMPNSTQLLAQLLIWAYSKIRIVEVLNFRQRRITF